MSPELINKPSIQLPTKIKKKTVQEYLDEMPVWADGTGVDLIPLTKMQWLIWILASAGKFFEGMVVFMTGIAIPLMVAEYNLNSFEQGVVGASSLIGILIGATVLGGLSDRFGRKNMFIIEMVIFVFFITALVFTYSFVLTVIMLFGAGIALGCDYPTANLMISETMPSRNRGKLVLSAFTFQSVGAFFGTLLGWLVLYNVPSVDAWRWMYAVAIIPAIIVVIARFFIVQSPHFLVSQGKIKEAQRELSRLLKRVPKYPKVIRIKKKDDKAISEIERQGSYGQLFTKYRRETIFASVPWFLQDLGTYGIGVFTPLIIAVTIGLSASGTSVGDVIHNDILAAKSTAFISLFLFVGIVFAIFLSDTVGRKKLQIFGFIGCAVGLAIAAIGHLLGDSLIYIFVGFILFQFMTNIGPNAQTYVIAGEVFPVHMRGKGAGFAASIGKVGAVLTTFLFPVLIMVLGIPILLFILVFACILGAWVTYKYGFETKGISLE